MAKIDDLIFYTIDRSIKTYRQYAQKQLVVAGQSITIDQWLVLNVLHENPHLNQAEVASRVFKDTASVTRIIDLLVKSDLLERTIHPEDRRRTEIRLTASGEKVMEDVKEIVLANRKTALKGITKNEINTLHEILTKIISNCVA